MTRAFIVSLMTIAALAGCRAPAPTYAPYGPQTVPPPVTGSIGTPAPQPAPYYQGSSNTTISPQLNTGGWQAPSTNLGARSLAQTPPTGNPTLNSTTTVGNGVAPNANFTSSGGQSFNTPQVTNPASIQNQGTNFGQPTNNSAIGAGSRSAQVQPWQPAGTTTGTPQLLQTNAPVGAQPSTNLGATGQPVNAGQPANTGQFNATQPNTTQPANTGQGGATWGQQPQPQPNSQWGQPPINTGSHIQMGPGRVPLNGMPVNDATAYGTTGGPWTMQGVANWFKAAMGQPTYGQPAYGQPVAYGQPMYQSQVVPASGYSTTAPAPAQLPVRGAQQNFAPASYPAPQPTGTQAAPVAPAAMQWGSVPMAQANASAATVRGNDDKDDETKPVGFVTTNQSSPVPHEAELYGQHENYHWLRGQLEYSISQRQWKLRYIPLDAPEGRMDAYGGSVVLTDSDELKSYQSGDFVLIKGRLAGGSTGQSGFAPLYEVQSISKL